MFEKLLHCLLLGTVEARGRRHGMVEMGNPAAADVDVDRTLGLRGKNSKFQCVQPTYLLVFHDLTLVAALVGACM